MATASRAPWTVAGSRPPAAASKRAPIFSSGAITRPIGRLCSEASPVKRALIGVDAMRPIESLRARSGVSEIEFPARRCRALRHRFPRTRHSPSPSRSTRAPSCAIAPAVCMTSSASRRPLTRVSPMASAAQHQRAVGNRLVSRNADASLEGARRQRRQGGGNGWGMQEVKPGVCGRLPPITPVLTAGSFSF